MFGTNKNPQKTGGWESSDTVLTTRFFCESKRKKMVLKAPIAIRLL